MALAALYEHQGRGLSYHSLKARAADEKWIERRKAFQEKISQKSEEKAQEKISEVKSKTLAELNEEHNELYEQLIGMHRALLAQYLGFDDKTGKKKLNCRANELARLSQSLDTLVKTQRLLHNFEPLKPMVGGTAEEVPGDKEDPLAEGMSASAQNDWSDHVD